MGTCCILGRCGWIDPSLLRHLQLVRTLVGNDLDVHGFWYAYANLEKREGGRKGKVGRKDSRTRSAASITRGVIDGPGVALRNNTIP